MAVGPSLHILLGTPGPDIDQVWVAARALLHGQDAYRAVWPDRGFDFPLFYPLTTVVLAIPLAPFSIDHARFLFAGVSGGVFGYVIGVRRPWLWPAFLGMPFLIASLSTQWSPLLTAAMLVPSLGWLAAAKPNLGLAMLAGARDRRSAQLLVIGGLLLTAISLAVDPHWPWKWRDAIAGATHFRPLLMRPAGFLALLALLRWRDPDARLVLALALVPTTGLVYDMLPLCLICQNRKQALVLSLASYGGWLAGPLLGEAHGFANHMWKNGTLVCWFALLPAVALVLRRGIAWPDWIKRRGHAFP